MLKVSFAIFEPIFMAFPYPTPSLEIYFYPPPWSKNLDLPPSTFDLAHVCPHLMWLTRSPKYFSTMWQQTPKHTPSDTNPEKKRTDRERNRRRRPRDFRPSRKQWQDGRRRQGPPYLLLLLRKRPNFSVQAIWAQRKVERGEEIGRGKKRKKGEEANYVCPMQPYSALCFCSFFFSMCIIDTPSFYYLLSHHY